MKNQALFSSKDKIKKSSAAIFVWHLRVKLLIYEKEDNVFFSHAHCLMLLYIKCSTNSHHQFYRYGYYLKNFDL